SINDELSATDSGPLAGWQTGPSCSAKSLWSLMLQLTEWSANLSKNWQTDRGLAEGVSALRWTHLPKNAFSPRALPNLFVSHPPPPRHRARWRATRFSP